MDAITITITPRTYHETADGKRTLQVTEKDERIDLYVVSYPNHSTIHKPHHSIPIHFQQTEKY